MATDNVWAHHAILFPQHGKELELIQQKLFRTTIDWKGQSQQGHTQGRFRGSGTPLHWKRIMRIENRIFRKYRERCRPFQCEHDKQEVGAILGNWYSTCVLIWMPECVTELFWVTDFGWDGPQPLCKKARHAPALLYGSLPRGRGWVEFLLYRGIAVGQR